MAHLSSPAKELANLILANAGLEIRKTSTRSNSQHLLDVEGENTFPPRVLVNTMPKAGTYLFAAIVEELGFHHTHLHLGDNKLQAYDSKMLTEGLKQPRRFDVNIPLSESRKLVRKGELAVGHIRHSQMRQSELQSFRMLLVVRELRASLVSFARMLAFSGKFGTEMAQKIKEDGVAPLLLVRGEASLKQIEDIFEWRKFGNALLVKFEDIIWQPQNVVEDISKFLGVTGLDLANVHLNAASKDTLTKSERYPKIDWDESAEKLFTELGGPQLNAKLGYDDELKKSEWR